MNIIPFLTQPQDFHTAASAGALASNRNAYMEHEDRQAQLAEGKRQFNETQPRLNFKAFGDQYNTNRDYDQKERENDTKLLEWVKGLVETDPEKAQASAPFLHGILKVHGIDMNFDGLDDKTGQPAQAASPQAEAPAEAAPEPAKSAAPAAKPYETKLDQGTKAATRKVPAQELPPGMSLDRYMAQNYAPEPEEKPVPEAPPQAPPQAAPMPQTPAPQAAPAAPGVAPPAEVQAEMAQQGQPYTGQTAPEPPPERPKGRWTFTKNGQELLSIEPGKLKELNERRTGAITRGFESSVLPPEDQAFVQSMGEAAREAGMNPEQVQKLIENVTQKELDRRTRERTGMATARAMAIKAGKGPDIGGIARVNEDLEKIQNRFASKYQMPKIEERRRAAETVEELAQSDNPIAQRDAFTAGLKAMFSGVTSDKELGFAKDAAGKLTRIEMAFNDWFNGGELPPNYLALLAEANAIIQEETRKEMGMIGDLAAGYVMRVPTLSLDAAGRKQAAGVVRGFFTGDYGETPELSGPMGVTGMKGGGPGGGSVSVTTSERTRGGNLSDKTPEAKRLLAPKAK